MISTSRIPLLFGFVAFLCLSIARAWAIQPGPPVSPAAIPFDQIGMEAQKQYRGEGLSVTPTSGGARLNAKFQQLKGDATREGLWLKSSSEAEAPPSKPFRVRASAIGRLDPAASPVVETRDFSTLPPLGTVRTSGEVVSFIRTGLVEEYRVSMDGIRQDFVIMERTKGTGELSLLLDVEGALATSSANGVRLTLDDSGREIAYHRLHVTDATGRVLAARMEVSAADRLAVRVDDTAAVYPVRIDPTFSDADWVSLNPSIAGANGSVLSIALDGSGNVYVGGSFTIIGNIAASRIARWNGSTWSPLGSGMSGTVHALIYQGSTLYAAGGFNTAGGITVNNIARWDGSAWSALGSGVNGAIHSLTMSGSDLYAGGTFSTAGGNPAVRIAKWNGSAWSNLGSGMNNEVNALAIMDGNLYAGGRFTTAGGVAVNRIAKWDGSGWSPLGTGISGPVIWALAVSGSTLYAGGNMTAAGGEANTSYLAKWDGSAWSAVGSGVTGGFVLSLLASGNDVYVGGWFNSAGGVADTRYVARWNGSEWSAVSSSTPDHDVLAMAVSGNDVYIGGSFQRVGDTQALCIAKWDSSAWSSFGSGGINNSVNAVTVSGTDLYIGGDFTTAGGVSANRIAKWNGSAWSGLGSGVDGSVYRLVMMGSNLYAAGSFSNAGEVEAQRIARWDGSSWSSLGSGMNSNVNALAVIGTDLYAGGSFSTAGGGSANRIAKWNGSEWSALGSGLDDTVRSMAVSGTVLYAGGDFTMAGEVQANRIARWDGSEWSALGEGVDDTVWALAVIGSDLYAGGDFSMAGETEASRIARWDGSTWSTLDTGTNNRVRDLAVSNGQLYAGGHFSSAGGVSASRLAKWNGSTWSGLGSGVNNSVYALAVDESNHLFAGGTFNFAGTVVSPYIVQANLPVLPEIVVEHPDSVALESGSANIGFGQVTLGASSSAKVFTIKNTGSAPLNITSISVTGDNHGDFTVSTSGTLATVPTGSETSFSVTFTPGGTGPRSTTLRISNDDENEGLFTISLNGSSVPNTAPTVTLTGANPRTVEAAASYSDPGATASDAQDGTLTPIITANTVVANVPGTYAVTWTATDTLGLSGSATRTVTVVDTTAPVITPPADIITNPASTAGAVVSFSATAVDAVGVASVTYSPASGSTFPIGSTPVTVTAKDAANNTGTATFNVTVRAMDKTPPTLTLTAPATSATTMTNPATITGTIKDDVGIASLSVKLNGELQTLDSPPAFAPNTPVPFQASGLHPRNGRNTVEVKVTDTAGKSATITRTLTYTNSRPDLAGTYDALLVPTGQPELYTSGLVTVTAQNNGSLSGKVIMGNINLAFTGLLNNDGEAQFGTALTEILEVRSGSIILGYLTLEIDAATGMSGNFSDNPTGGVSLAALTGEKAPYTAANLVPDAYLNQPATGTLTKGVYAVALGSKAQAPVMDPATYPQGDGYCLLTLSYTGGVSIAGFLADGTTLAGTGKLRADGTVAIYQPLYSKQGCFGSEITFSDEADSDLTGVDSLWIRPPLTGASAYEDGWPAGVRVDAVGTHFSAHANYGAPRTLDFGQGADDTISGNASLNFQDGLLASPLSYALSLHPTTGVVTETPDSSDYSLGLTKSNGIISGSILHSDGTTLTYRGIILNKGSNQGGFGYFMSSGAGGQGGGVTLDPAGP